MIILVNGLMAYNAGKTSLARAILLRARREGMDFCAFKPKSAHNYWEHLDHSKVCQELGTLASMDAMKMREICSDPPALELMNPYHQLVCPLDFTKVRKGGEYLLADHEDHILAERLTCPDAGSTLYLSQREDMFVAPEDFLEAMKRGVSKVERFSVSPAGEGIAPVEDCVRSVFEVLSAKYSNIVVESNSDVALPLQLGEGDMDIAVSVGGPAVFLIAPRALLRAVEVLRGRSMRELLKYVKPLATHKLPHLTSRELSDDEILEGSFESVLENIWDRLF